MKLPNASAARVDLRKLSDYVLSGEHPVGRFKSRFFRDLGFSQDRPEELMTALIRLASHEVVVQSVSTTFGTKYVVDGDLIGPNRTKSRLRTVWILERGSASPRFVTAYPAK